MILALFRLAVFVLAGPTLPRPPMPTTRSINISVIPTIQKDHAGRERERRVRGNKEEEGVGGTVQGWFTTSSSFVRLNGRQRRHRLEVWMQCAHEEAQKLPRNNKEVLASLDPRTTEDTCRLHVGFRGLWTSYRPLLAR